MIVFSKQLLLTASTAALGLAAGQASAATYVADRDVGTGHLSLSITTDGTLGYLKNENILSYAYHIEIGGVTHTLDETNSSIDIYEDSNNVSALSATNTDIFFEIDLNSSSGGVVVFGGNGGAYYCFLRYLCGTQSSSYVANAEFISHEYPTGPYARGETHWTSGSILYASVASDHGVPEPATWALTIGGLGLAGGIMRRKRGVSLKFA